MTNKLTHGVFAALGLSLLMWPIYGFASLEPEIGEPKISLIDGNFVNVPAGTIHYQLNDVGIGSGAMRLEHGITLNSTNILNQGGRAIDTPRVWGYKDKFMGGIHKRVHTDNLNYCSVGHPTTNCDGTSMGNLNTFYVFDEQGSYDFYINEGGEFEAIGDLHTSLEVIPDRMGFLLTRNDGTKVHYRVRVTAVPQNIDNNYDAYAVMHRIEYPTGFTIDIHKDSVSSGIGDPIRSVTSNNGLQLKYVYEYDTRPVPAETLQRLEDAGKPNDALNFSDEKPKRIIALNNAVEVCPLLAKSCAPVNEWPTTEYTWPVASPWSMFVEDTTFTVSDAYGVVTNFIHSAVQTYASSYFNVPRLVELNNNKGVKVNYGYIDPLADLPQWRKDAMSHQYYMKGNFGALSTANSKSFGETTLSNFGSKKYNTTYPSDLIFNHAYDYKGVGRIDRQHEEFFDFYDGRRGLNTAPEIVQTWDKTITYTRDFYNLPVTVYDKLTEITSTYHYDAKKRFYMKQWGFARQHVTYVTSETEACLNPKTCNKVRNTFENYLIGDSPSPGSMTTYEYHEPSGQISSVTEPLQRQTKLFYDQYNARFLNANGQMADADSSIWLLSSKETCLNSTFSGSQCTENDKITTTYEYGSGTSANNLFLLGETIFSQADNKTRITCFKYDRYGNQIATTAPKSGVTDCNLNRGY